MRAPVRNRGMGRGDPTMAPTQLLGSETIADPEACTDLAYGMHDARNGALPPTNDIASLLIVAAAFVFIGWATSSYLIGACTGSASLPAQFHVLVRKKECMAIPLDSPKMHAGRIAAEKSVIRSAWGRWDLRQQLPPSSGPSDSAESATLIGTRRTVTTGCCCTANGSMCRTHQS